MEDVGLASALAALTYERAHERVRVPEDVGVPRVLPDEALRALTRTRHGPMIGRPFSTSSRCGRESGPTWENGLPARQLGSPDLRRVPASKG